MREADFDAFAAMLDDVAGLYGKVLTPGQKAITFRALAAYPLAEVRAAFHAHVQDPQRGRFMPLPADVIAQIDGLAADDGRPGPEEAWAIALRAADEADTVVWTAEMAEAWAIARPLLEGRDQVGARMAFREAYARLVDAARRQRMPATWSASFGFDAGRRHAALAEAAAAGRIPMADIPQLPGRTPPLLGLAQVEGIPENARRALLQLSETLANREPPPSVDAADRQRTSDLKARAAELVAHHEQRHRAAFDAEVRLAEEGDAQQDAA